MSENLKYGLRHRPVEDEETHLMRWIVLVLVVVAVVSFMCARGCKKTIEDMVVAPLQPATPAPQQPAPLVADAGPTAEPAPATNLHAGVAAPVDANAITKAATTTVTTTAAPAHVAPSAHVAPPARPAPPQLSAAAKLAEKWLGSAATRPQMERTLLERLADAERQERFALAIDTIERLRARPAMADLDDPLARRLGALNMKLLYSGAKNPWTTTVEVRRGDNLQRLAREHGTTLAAALTLNSLKDSNHISIGQKIRLLEFPKAALVVHKRTKIADLTLNGKFFKRYYVSTGEKTAVGPYPITREKGPLDRFSELGIKAAESDRDELKMFLAPGSSLAIADP